LTHKERNRSIVFTSIPWITLRRDIHRGYPQIDLELIHYISQSSSERTFGAAKGDSVHLWVYCVSIHDHCKHLEVAASCCEHCQGIESDARWSASDGEVGSGTKANNLQTGACQDRCFLRVDTTRALRSYLIITINSSQMHACLMSVAMRVGCLVR
jgi:hypothetical protein